MGLAQYLPQGEPGIYGTTLTSRVLSETDDVLHYEITARNDDLFGAPAVVRMDNDFTGLDGDIKEKLMKSEITHAIMSLEYALKSEAIRLGFFSEEMPGPSGETYVYGYDAENKLATFQARTASGGVIGSGALRYDGENGNYTELMLECHRLRREYLTTIVAKYQADDYQTLARS